MVQGIEKKETKQVSWIHQFYILVKITSQTAQIANGVMAEYN